MKPTTREVEVIDKRTERVTIKRGDKIVMVVVHRNLPDLNNPEHVARLVEAFTRVRRAA